MKKTLFLSLLGASMALVSCNTAKTSNQSIGSVEQQTPYWHNVNQDSLSKYLKVITSEHLEGRRTGEPGQKRAAAYLEKHYVNNGISAPTGADSYFQEVPASFMKTKANLKDSENVWAFIPGSEKPEEVLIVTAHYDHMGLDKGEYHYGADDNGSGTVAVMEIARVFQDLAKKGISPKRSVLFIHLTGEEFGLWGSRYYVENPIVPLENSISNINIDMIGRRSYEYPTQDDYVFVIGADKISQDLHDAVEKSNKESVGIDLDYKFNDDNDPQRIYYRSDHYSFAKHGIPAVFFYNGAHEDYHTPRDTYDRIDMDLLTKRTQLIFATAWELANQDERPQVTEK
ncbi:M28 family metallopeptidase [Myroides sp. LJL119]